VNRRAFLKIVGWTAASALGGVPQARAAQSRRLNILLFTADDLHRDSLGCFGGKVPDLTPNLDAFAAQGMRFENAHVTVAICQPSRGVLGTGRYGHNSGIMGFMHTDRDVPTVMETLGQAGYRTGVLGKVGHSTPKASYQWDFVHDQKDLGNGRDPEAYYSYCRQFLADCRRDGKPFYFMVNSHDPHRPYHVAGQPMAGAKEPSRTYTPQEVPVPGFVPDLPGVREELSCYLNSTRRLDDTFGAAMRALQESGFAENTLVMFLSDNGIAIPFAKCNAYLASTRTPWIVRWPGVVQPGTVDRRHFISGIDFFPTALDAVELPIPKGLDGFSFVPLLKGESQAGRERVFTQIDMQSSGEAVPMRCVQDSRFGYIFTPWSDGQFFYRNANEGLTMKAMVEAAPTDAGIAERVRMFRYRDLEEFYDLQKDPDCLVNLIGKPQCQGDVDRLRGQLQAWMKQTRDPLLETFENRYSDEKRKAALTKVYGAHYTQAVDRGAKTRAGSKQKKGKRKQ